MCNDQMHALLRALPKCEHHMHLEGALTPELLFKLAEDNKITLPQDDQAFGSIHGLYERYKTFANLDDFLHYYYIGMSCLITKEDFERLAWDYFQHASRDGVVHAEVFFDPQAHLSRGVAYSTVLSGFQAAQSKALKELSITSELICCFLRHLPASDCLQTFQLQEVQDSLTKGGVAGIGLDSSEAEFPPQLFKDMYGRAKDLGIRRTAHAGEEGPASFIRDAIDLLDVGRIDHGIKLRDDPVLLKRLAANKTLLTVCPWSNVLLQCATSVAELPIREFLDAGVQFSINSDDPAYFGNHYILDNYCAVQDAFHLTVGDWETICQASIRGSWCSDRRKEEMLAMLEAVIRQHD